MGMVELHSNGMPHPIHENLYHHTRITQQSISQRKQMYNHNFNKSIARDYSNSHEHRAIIMELFINHNTTIQNPNNIRKSYNGKDNKKGTKTSKPKKDLLTEYYIMKSQPDHMILKSHATKVII